MRDTATNGGNPNVAENKFRGKGRGNIKQPLTELRDFACMNARQIKQGGEKMEVGGPIKCKLYYIILYYITYYYIILPIRPAKLDRRLVGEGGGCSLRAHFEFTLGPLRAHFEFTSSSLQFHFGFTSMSLRFHFEFTSISLRFHFYVTLISLRCNFGVTWISL